MQRSTTMELPHRLLPSLPPQTQGTTPLTYPYSEDTSAPPAPAPDAEYPNCQYGTDRAIFLCRVFLFLAGASPTPHSHIIQT